MYLLLMAFWIILNGRFTVEILILGFLFTAVIYAFAHKFMGFTWQKEKSFWKHLIWAIHYLLVLLKEITVSNMTMLRILLAPRKKTSPVLVRFESPLKSKLLQVILADSITLTPGTITVRLHDNKFEVHCLDASLARGLDCSAFVKILKKWEEAPSE